MYSISVLFCYDMFFTFFPSLTNSVKTVFSKIFLWYLSSFFWWKPVLWGFNCIVMYNSVVLQHNIHLYPYTASGYGEFPKALPRQLRANIKWQVFHKTCAIYLPQTEWKRAISSRCMPPHCCCLLCSGLPGLPCLTSEGTLLKRDVLYIVGAAAGSQLG